VKVDDEGKGDVTGEEEEETDNAEEDRDDDEPEEAAEVELLEAGRGD
jgi:hypothetical protein